MRNSAVEILLLAVMSAALETACAQSTSAPRLATRDEYRACRLAEQAFDRRKSRLEALIDQHNQASAQHQAEGSKYMAERQRKGISTPSEVATYNQNVSRLNARAKNIAQMQRDLIKEQDGFNAEVLRINAQCGSQIVNQELADEVDQEYGKKSKP